MDFLSGFFNRKSTTKYSGRKVDEIPTNAVQIFAIESKSNSTTKPKVLQILLRITC